MSEFFSEGQAPCESWNFSLLDNIVEKEAYADVPIEDLDSKDGFNCGDIFEDSRHSESGSIQSNADHDTEDSTLGVEHGESEDVVMVRTRKEGHSETIIRIDKTMLEQHFHEKMEIAAKSLVSSLNIIFPLKCTDESGQGVGKSTMKLVCRKLGVLKWPYTSKGVRRNRMKTK